MKIINGVLLFVLISFQLSCNKRETAPNVSKELKTASLQEVKTETTEIEAEDYSFPVDSILKTKILNLGVFHGDEVDQKLEKKNWFGLFKSNDNYALKVVDLSIKHANDPIVDDDETVLSGWEVSSSVKDSCVILIEKLPYLAEGNVPTVKIPKSINLGDRFSFSFLNVDYELSAVGEKKKESPDSDYDIISNYKLYLTAKIDGKTKKVLLVEKKNLDDRMIAIIFVGDIDGDSKLDLIIDTSHHYNVSSPILYLSKEASKEEIIKPVGVFTTVGC